MKKMEIFVKNDNVKYLITYNEHFIDETLKTLGISGTKCVTCIKKCILYFSIGKKNMNVIYDLIANEFKLSRATIISHIRNGLVASEFNGGLKNIDDVLGIEVYDYDYGFTNKSFVALICDYMKNNKLLTTSVV
jgi:hypothetical protein